MSIQLSKIPIFQGIEEPEITQIMWADKPTPQLGAGEFYYIVKI